MLSNTAPRAAPFLYDEGPAFLLNPPKKLAEIWPRASKAVTTIPSLINSPLQLSKPTVGS